MVMFLTLFSACIEELKDPSKLIIHYSDGSRAPLNQSRLYCSIGIMAGEIISMFNDECIILERKALNLLESPNSDADYLSYLKADQVPDCRIPRLEGRYKASLANSIYSCVTLEGLPVSHNCIIVRHLHNGKWSAYLKSTADIPNGEKIVVNTYGSVSVSDKNVIMNMYYVAL
jgi:hypothetical protein